jgi:predicted dehydrogenase
MQISRRNFAVSTVATALSAARVYGANDRIRIGLIGCGGRGKQDWTTLLKQKDAQPVVVCDLFEPFRAQAAQMAGGVEQDPDFRRVLDRKDLDAVILAVPDHWHAYMTTAACEAGKDVYCEKPLSLTIDDGKKMVAAARRCNRVVQAGSQQRSGTHYAQAAKMIQDGAIGEVHEIRAGMTRNAVGGFKPTQMADGPAPGFDWNLWLGPAPQRPFDAFRCIYNFRWFWDYSGGQMTNWGAHHLDIARWFLNEQAPLSVAAFGGRYTIRDGGETPDLQEVIYRFPKAIVTWTTREICEGGAKFDLQAMGTKGVLTITRSRFTITPETIKGQPAMEAMEVKGNNLDDAHMRNFLDCIKSRKHPNADVEEGHRSAVMCHLGNIATRLNRAVQWDAVSQEVLHDAEAAAMMSRPYRAPWKLA